MAVDQPGAGAEDRLPSREGIGQARARSKSGVETDGLGTQAPAKSERQAFRHRPVVFGVFRDFRVGSLQHAGALESDLLGRRAVLIEEADRLGCAVPRERAIKEIDAKPEFMVSRAIFLWELKNREKLRPGSRSAKSC